MNRIHSYVLTIFLIISFIAKSQNTTLVDAGDILLYAIPAATLASTFIVGDTKGSWEFTKGLVLTEGITFGLKALVHKSRPDKSNRNSFPSAHTSTSFHSAAFIHRRYGVIYAIPAYALAGITGLTRIYGERHDGFDILIGAVLELAAPIYLRRHINKNICSSHSVVIMRII